MANLILNSTRVVGQAAKSSLCQRSSAFRAGRQFKPSQYKMAPRKQAYQNLQVQSLFGGGKSAPSGSFHDYTVKDINGSDVNLSEYKGKVVLVVNVASQCGFTPQYKELESIHKKYMDKGLVVLGFPCNQFGGQEPGSNQDIKNFAQNNMGATFPLMAKVDVNGDQATPVYKYLKGAKGGWFGDDIGWNFTKFLLNKEGEVVERYGSITTPTQIEADIEKII